jgi:hypothetical protein
MHYWTLVQQRRAARAAEAERSGSFVADDDTSMKTKRPRGNPVPRIRSRRMPPRPDPIQLNSSCPSASAGGLDSRQTYVLSWRSISSDRIEPRESQRSR